MEKKDTKDDNGPGKVEADIEAKKITFVYTTVASADEARSMALACTKEKLAISADFWQINSIYQWHDEMQDISQFMIMLTTEKGKNEDLIKFVGDIHSYSTPMIAACDTEMVNKSYLYWADSVLLGHEMYEPGKNEDTEVIDQEADDLHLGSLK